MAASGVYTCHCQGQCAPGRRFIQQYLETRIPVGPSQPQAASLREATSRSARGPGVHSVTGGAPAGPATRGPRRTLSRPAPGGGARPAPSGVAGSYLAPWVPVTRRVRRRDGVCTLRGAPSHCQCQ